MPRLGVAAVWESTGTYAVRLMRNYVPRQRAPLVESSSRLWLAQLLDRFRRFGQDDKGMR